MERIKLENNDGYNTIKDRLAKMYICLFKISVANLDEDNSRFFKEIRDLILNIYEKTTENNYTVTLTIVNAVIDALNKFLSDKSLEIIELKSAHPSMYSDFYDIGKIIAYEDIAEYFKKIPKEKKYYAQKTETVYIRDGKPGELIKTKHIALVDNQEYILDEEENIVGESKVYPTDKRVYPDEVVRTVFNVSHEERIISFKKRLEEYEMYGYSRSRKEALCKPKKNPQLVAKVSENLVIKMPSGKNKVCLAGSYIVKTDSDEEPYIIIDRGDFNATYTKDEKLIRSLKKGN